MTPCARALSFVFAACLLGCATTDASTTPDRSARRLVVLERDFVAFTARKLTVGDDGQAVDPFRGVDDAVADLERLRLDYLDALSSASGDDARVHALVRIAELHLDLGARIRRLPYPTGATVDEQRAFDERLSRLALPLEAVGFGVLAQAEETARIGAVDTRFARRARLYLALHDQDRPLLRDDVETLKKELGARGAYAAPKTLLEAGRLGQRAARR